MVESDELRTERGVIVRDFFVSYGKVFFGIIIPFSTVGRTRATDCDMHSKK